MGDKHRVTEEPCDGKLSSTVLESGGSREGVADFNFVDDDYLPKYGEKPDDWKPSGRRVKRGLYRTALNWYLKADCNGAGNILRKVSGMLGLNLSGLSRVQLTAPQRVFLWSAKKTRRDAVSTRPEVSA